MSQIVGFYRAANNLRGVPAPTSDSVAIADGDFFEWTPSSTATADDDYVVAVTGVTTGRWVRNSGRASGYNTVIHRVRGVAHTNVADLAAFVIAAFDGLTYAAGDRILLLGQTTGAQNGIYTVGTVDTTAPLTRSADWAAAAVIPPGTMVAVDAGSIWGNALLSVTNTGNVTVATTTPTFRSHGPLKMSLTADHTTITTAGSSQVIAIGTIPANSRVSSVSFGAYTAFSGGTISDFTCDVGGTDVDMIVDGANLYAAAVNGNISAKPLGVNSTPFFATATALTATFLCGSDDVADATAGSITIDVIFDLLA